MLDSPLSAFTPWIRWQDRSALDLKFPGVYLLAAFKRTPPPGAPVLSKRIIYIGETCRTLRSRLGGFNRAALKGNGGHSGGTTFHYATDKPPMSELCVSVLSVKSEQEPQVSAYIRYVERALIWDFVKKYRRLPRFNRE